MPFLTSAHVRAGSAVDILLLLILYRLPEERFISFCTVVVPLVAPIVSAVAAPAKLIVVAVVFSRLNDVLAVVIDVVNDGLVPNTSEPDPVSSVIADAKFADDGVAKNVATPVPKPEISFASLTVRVLFAPFIVLFVNVSDPAREAKSASVTAVLN